MKVFKEGDSDEALYFPWLTKKGFLERIDCRELTFDDDETTELNEMQTLQPT